MEKTKTVLLVKRIIGRRLDGKGNSVLETRWEKHKGNLSLGSMKNPKNLDIVAYKWVSENPLKDLFGGL